MDPSPIESSPPNAPSTATPRWRPWILPAAVFLLVIAALLHYANHDTWITSFSWVTLEQCISCIIAACIYAFPAVLAAAILRHNNRLRPLARLCILLAFLEIPNQIYYYFFRSDATWTNGYAMASALRVTINFGCIGCTIAALALLPILRPRHARLRTIALSALFVLLLLDPGESLAYHFFNPGYIQHACILLQLLAALTLLVLLPLVIYRSLRHPLPFPHRPPPDAAPAITLTCPRCNTPQSIPPNGGRCPNCQLRIYIALAEATCAHCGYRLRGLTSGRCPECGKSISTAPPDPNAPLLAWAAANDQRTP